MEIDPQNTNVDYSTKVPDLSINERELKAKLEALLLVASGPVTPSQLAAALEIQPAEVETGLSGLAADYQQRGLAKVKASAKTNS